MRPVKLPVLRIGQPCADSCAATWAARWKWRELLSTVTGSRPACVCAGCWVAGGWVAGGWATGGADACCVAVGVAAGGVDGVEATDVTLGAPAEFGFSATAPGPGPDADGRLLSTSRST